MTATLITNSNSSCPPDNHADTIARTTQALEELTSEDLGHLYRRAVAFVMCGKFEAAFNDASTMVSLSPSSALPYLCMGYVYAQQGRYGAAIHVYDQGLQAVSSDDQQQQLSKARSTAQSHNDTRIDFIKRLPTHDDVFKKMVEHILPESKETTIQTNQLYEYMNVSRAWRERLLQCLPKDLHIQLVEHQVGLAKMDYLLEHAAAVSRIIALTVTCVVTHPQSLLPSISRFSSLRSLCIEKMAHDAPRPVLALLSPLASTLEHLDVRSDDHDHFSLGDILSTFPQLTWLRCHGNIGDISSAPSLCLKLKTLLFWMPDNVLDYKHVMDLTARLPQLTQLAIHPCTDTRALTSIYEHCPHLKVLYYNSINHASNISNVGLESYQQEDDIESLHLGCQSEEKAMRVDIQDLVSFLNRHHHSLRHLDFCYLLTDASIISFGSVVPGDDEGALFESLRSYSQTVYSDEDLLALRWLAKRSPHLKKIMLQEEEDEDEGITPRYDLGPLFDDLACLDELEHLRVDVGCQSTSNSACRCLQHHSNIDSHLHTLEFPRNFRIGVGASDFLGSLPRLERLSMHVYDAYNLLGLQEGCSRLRHLTVYSGFDLIGIKMAFNLASLTHLRTLCIWAKCFEYALLPCFKSLHQLQELTIYRQDSEDHIDPAYLEMLPFPVRVLEYGI